MESKKIYKLAVGQQIFLWFLAAFMFALVVLCGIQYTESKALALGGGALFLVLGAGIAVSTRVHLQLTDSSLSMETFFKRNRKAINLTRRIEIRTHTKVVNAGKGGYVPKPYIHFFDGENELDLDGNFLSRQDLRDLLDRIKVKGASIKDEMGFLELAASKEKHFLLNAIFASFLILFFVFMIVPPFLSESIQRLLSGLTIEMVSQKNFLSDITPGIGLALMLESLLLLTLYSILRFSPYKKIKYLRGLSPLFLIIGILCLSGFPMFFMTYADYAYVQADKLIRVENGHEEFFDFNSLTYSTQRDDDSVRYFLHFPDGKNIDDNYSGVKNFILDHGIRSREEAEW